MHRLLAGLAALSTFVVFLFVTAPTQCVAQPASAPPSVAAAADPDAVARGDYQAAARVGNRAAWDDFLKRYPSGLYSDLARAQLVRIAIIAVPDAKAAPERADKANTAGAQAGKSATSKTAVASAPPSAAPSPVAAPAVVSSPAASDPNAAARRDYELAAQLGTREAWQAYLKQYPSGFFADLARVQLDKATKQGSENTPAGPIKQSGLASPADSSVAPSLSGGALVEEIKKELKRVGCYAGPIDDNWTARQTDVTLKKFAKLTGSPAPDKPTTDFLVLLRSQLGRVCPLECSKREVEKDGQCVAKTCKSGFEPDEDGDCVRQKSHRG